MEQLAQEMELDLEDSGQHPDRHHHHHSSIDQDPEAVVRHFSWGLNLETGSTGSGSQIELVVGSSPPVLKQLPVVFRWKGEAKSISISGSYDNWKTKMPLVKSREDFYTVVEVPEGTHQYKYLVDGEWQCHPNEPMIENDLGSKNNVFTVKESDCDLDLMLSSPPNSESEILREMALRGEFSQHIPAKETGYCFMRAAPPSIPPHLMQTILNREISAHCEPTLAVEPNHVILNHLYTLSIKDGILVMSATHRYRRKYITTVLYRPIAAT